MAIEYYFKNLIKKKDWTIFKFPDHIQCNVCIGLVSKYVSEQPGFSPTCFQTFLIWRHQPDFWLENLNASITYLLRSLLMSVNLFFHLSSQPIYCIQYFISHPEMKKMIWLVAQQA